MSGGAEDKANAGFVEHWEAEDVSNASLEPSFAERVAEFVSLSKTGLYANERDTLSELLACIREQQAALEAVSAEVEWFVSRRKNLDEPVEGSADRSWADVLDEDLKPARAVLAKWRIE